MAKIRSIRRLAEQVGRAGGTVCRWLKRDDFPVRRQAPWTAADVRKLKAWAETLGREGSGDAESQGLRTAKLQQEIRKIRAQADQAEAALARERAGLHDTAECDQQRLADNATVAAAVNQLPPQFLPLALGLGMPAESAAVFQEQAAGLCKAVLRQMDRGRDDDAGGRDDE